MPNRVIREGILTSERVNRLECCAEVFYRRLLSKVDDHGLFDARPSILLASLYPLKVKTVDEADCAKWLRECVDVNLVRVYLVDGKPFLQVLDTRWTTRSAPRFPVPESADKCEQTQTPARNCEQGSAIAPLVVLSKSLYTARNKARAPRTQLPADFAISDRVRSWAEGHGIWNIEAHFDHFVTTCRAHDYRYVDWTAAFMTAVRKDWAKIGKGSPPNAAKRVSL